MQKIAPVGESLLLNIVDIVGLCQREKPKGEDIAYGEFKEQGIGADALPGGDGKGFPAVYGQSADRAACLHRDTSNPGGPSAVLVVQPDPQSVP